MCTYYSYEHLIFFSFLFLFFFFFFVLLFTCSFLFELKNSTGLFFCSVYLSIYLLRKDDRLIVCCTSFFFSLYFCVLRENCHLGTIILSSGPLSDDICYSLKIILISFFCLFVIIESFPPLNPT